MECEKILAHYKALPMQWKVQIVLDLHTRSAGLSLEELLASRSRSIPHQVGDRMQQASP
jgi:hypothetical protein